MLKADEGMWLPFLIEQNMATMTEKGFKLTKDDVYNINQSCLKDAIVSLDHGSCTGEIISEKGLVLTNHHCAYSEIQSHSTVSKDYLTEGFWATSLSEELPNPEKTASILVKVENVTEQIMSSISDTLTHDECERVIKNKISDIIDESTFENNCDASVESFYYDTEYYLFLYNTYNDVRLVGAPPESIGKFGGEYDNWEWPRHTGDFTLFRIYTDTAGNPAQYSPDNIPLKPKYALPISLSGYNEGDFTFVMGYPGYTTRFVTSHELKYIMECENKVRALVREEKQRIWKKYMDTDEAIRLKYSSKYAKSANYWKYSVYQNKALRSNNVDEIKKQRELEFSEWVSSNDSLSEIYGEALTLVNNGIEESKEIMRALNFLYETHISGAELFLVAYLNAPAMLKALQSGNDEEIIDATAIFSEKMADFFKDYDSKTDKATTKALIKLFMENIAPNLYPSFIDTDITKKHKGNADKYVDYLFEHSIFCSEEKVKYFLNKPSAKKLAKDPVFIAAESIVSMYNGYFAIMSDADNMREKGMNLYVNGLRAMNPDKNYYPDANSTLRLTYGEIGDYEPGDAVYYNYFTTLKGVIEKHDETMPEFNVPAKLMEIFANKDYGIYGNADSTMNVCFITDNDITGGNSGSPVLNARGELIGTAFDGNLESMSGDIEYDSDIQKCINVDIRYILLIIDKFAGASNIIEELIFAKPETNNN